VDWHGRPACRTVAHQWKRHEISGEWAGLRAARVSGACNCALEGLGPGVAREHESGWACRMHAASPRESDVLARAVGFCSEHGTYYMGRQVATALGLSRLLSRILELSSFCVWLVLAFSVFSP